MYKLTFFVPESHLEQVKEALFSAGAGKIGDYECCAWQIKGQGQFKALKGSQPFVGQIDQLETLEEYRVEMVCESIAIKAVVQALHHAHPYETPAYDIVKLEAI